MFKFHLVKDEQIELPSNNPRPQACPWNLNLWMRNVTVPVVMKSATTGSGGEAAGDDECAKIRALLNRPELGDGVMKEPEFSQGSKGKSKKRRHVGSQEVAEEPLRWILHVTIGMDTQGHATDCRDFIHVQGADSGNLLTKLKAVMERHGFQMNMMVEVTNFGMRMGSYGIIATKEVAIDELTSAVERTRGARFHMLEGIMDRRYWNPQSNYVFTGSLTITATIVVPFACKMEFLLSVSPRTEATNVNKKILDGEIYSDATIVSRDQVEVKCHKSFLAGNDDTLMFSIHSVANQFSQIQDSIILMITNLAQSSVLGTNFKDVYAESQTSTIKMEDMACTSVKALLDYLYYEGIDKASKDCSIAIDLLRAGDKYDIPRLVECMKMILLSKPNDWFNAEAAMQLYLLARNILDGDVLKKKAGTILKLNHSSLDDSPSYKRLFLESSDVAMELCKYLCSL